MTSSVKVEYAIRNAPMGARRPLRVVCIGAGYSGLMMSIIIAERMKDQNIDYQVYDRNDDLGGTWLVNKYPGCQCDIPAHNYEYSFSPNPNWPNYYATSEQIQHYMKDVSKKYGCDRFFKYRHQIRSAIWDNASGKWDLKILDIEKPLEFADSCDILINAGGVLSNWKWPDIPGIQTFKGKLMHSANWDQSYNFRGKNVAVIGVGSSGIQIIPEVAKASPKTFCEPNEHEPKVDEYLNYTAAEIERFNNEPEYLLQHRQSLANRRIVQFKATMAGGDVQLATDAAFRKSMTSHLGDSAKGREIASWLIPKFPVGCRRLTPGPGFLESLLRDNVESIWNDIGAINERGIITKDGKQINFDAIVCATGFDNSFQPRFPLIGRNGVNLAAKWEQNDPECYFGTTIPDFPNYFTFIGPNSPLSNGSLVQAIQATGIYIYNCIEKMQTQGIKSMEVSEQACRDYNEHAQEWLKDRVWSGPCSSWYKRGTKDGRVVAIYAGSAFHFVESLRKPRWEDYYYELVNNDVNRFAYLGNGFTRREARGGDVGDTQTLNFDDFWNLFELPAIYD